MCASLFYITINHHINGTKKAHATCVGFPILVVVGLYGMGCVVFSQNTCVLSYDTIAPKYEGPWAFAPAAANSISVSVTLCIVITTLMSVL